MHKHWLGDISGKKIMDLGCHVGNELSLYMAIACESYVGVDLSASALSLLNERLETGNAKNFKLLPIDVLSHEFPENEFDVIYAKAVFHHFQYFEVFLIRIKKLLKPNGIIITFDPLDTYLPLKVFRKIYRSFQKDKDWEYPFDTNTLTIIQKYYNIKDIAGVMGKTKRAIPLYILSKQLAIKHSKKWILDDMYNVGINDKNMNRCLRVSLFLENSK